jgi:hypothetical protein
MMVSGRTRFTIRVQKLDRPELVAYDRILRRYGAGCYLQQTEDVVNHYRVPFGVYVPSVMHDEKTEQRKTLTFNFSNIGEILIKKSTLGVMKSTPLRSLQRNIAQKRRHIGQLVEHDLIKVFGDEQVHIEFSKLRHALGGLEPITRTLVRLLQEGYPTYEESAEVGSHYTEQIRMLLDLGYAEYKPSIMDSNARLEATNKLKGIYMHEKNIDKTIDVVLGMVLSEFYYDLQKEMRIFQFVPYVKATTGYYSNAIQFGKLLRMSENCLKNVTRDFYRGIPITKRVNYGYSTIVSGLVDAKILDYDGEYITGRENIFNKLIDIRSELPINEEPVILG